MVATEAVSIGNANRLARKTDFRDHDWSQNVGGNRKKLLILKGNK